MSIESVTLKKVGRGGTWRRDWKRTYKLIFQVECTDQYSDATSVLWAVDPNTGIRIPNLGEFYYFNSAQFDGGSYVEEVDAECTSDDGKQWAVTVTYGPYDVTQFDAQNPLEAPPKVKWGLSRTTRVADVDADGNAVTNSAGQSFDPPLEKDDSRLTLTIELNIPVYDPIEMAQYKDKVNSDSFWGFDPNMVKVMNIGANLAQSGDCPTDGGFYWEAVFEFEIHEETWTSQVLDQGLMCVSSGQLQRCVDDKGEPVTEPVPLDGGGGQLSTGGSPVFISVQKYESIEFSGLNLNPRGLP